MEATICRYIASVEFEAPGQCLYINTDQIILQDREKETRSPPYLAV